MAAGRGKNQKCPSCTFPSTHPFCSSVWCVLRSELVLLPWFCPSTAALLCNFPWGCVTAFPKRLGHVLACSQRLIQTQESSLPSAVKDFTISPVPKNLPTGFQASGCAFEKLLKNTVLWYQSVSCTKPQCASSEMRPVRKTGSSARKMGKHLQLDFSYIRKGYNKIFFFIQPDYFLNHIKMHQECQPL